MGKCDYFIFSPQICEYGGRRLHYVFSQNLFDHFKPVEQIRYVSMEEEGYIVFSQNLFDHFKPVEQIRYVSMEEEGYIMVTGGAGYVGAHVLVELIYAGYQTLCLDYREDAMIERLNTIYDITGHRPVSCAVNLLDKPAIQNVFAQFKISAVLHLAGLKAVRESHNIPLQYYNVNVIGTINLIEVMVQYKTYNIIFSSSSKVYGIPQYFPIDENHPTGQCTNPYGKTKHIIEQLLLDLTVADKQWNVIILRYFNPCGAHDSGKLGDVQPGHPKNLMPAVCYTAMGKLDKLSIYGHDYDTPDGTAIKDYTHVVDLAKGHIAAIKSLGNPQNYKVFNLGAGRKYSILEMVKTFEKISGRKINVKLCDRKPGEIGECLSDSSKAERELHWKAEKTLEEMCTDMWRWATLNQEITDS